MVSVGRRSVFAVALTFQMLYFGDIALCIRYLVVDG
jgi:hypothetical protein